MHVNWRNTAGTLLRSDQLTLPLTTSWTQATAILVAPAGTTRVGLDFSNSAGGAGNTVWLDDIVVGNTSVVPPSTTIPPPTAQNLLDADTATVEGSTGKWVPWFSAAVSRSTTTAHGGSASLKVDVAAPHGWGVTQSNWPGFAATTGPKALSFWGVAPTGTGLAATMHVNWRNASGAVLRTDVLNLALTATWAQATANVTAPVGTASVGVDFTNSAGSSGNSVYLDDIAVMVGP